MAKITTLSLHPYDISLTSGEIRQGALINIIDEEGNSGWGEIAPLPKWSHETLNDSLKQLHQKQEDILEVHWTPSHCLQELEKLKALPSVCFGLESALLSILNPVSKHTVLASALFMGSP